MKLPGKRDAWGQAPLLAAAIGAALAGREIISRLREADLYGNVALVTGGSRGLGFLLARELAREGCRLAICARDPDEIMRARQALEREGAEVLPVCCDVANDAQVDQMVAQVLDRLGAVDLLINNAGVIQVGPLQAMTLRDYEQTMDTMYWGTVYPTLAVLPSMLARKHGRIVNITSIGGKVSVPHLLPYSCAKFAAVGFSEGLRAELAGTGVTVTAIAPGLMRTGSYLNASFKGQQAGEFTWFSLGANLPFISMDAERAARQIVRATKRGEAERVLSIPAQTLAWFHGLFPGVTADLLGLVNRAILPKDGRREQAAMRGREVQAAEPSAPREALTGWGRDAARRFLQDSGSMTGR